jgi:hypothetical protein
MRIYYLNKISSYLNPMFIKYYPENKILLSFNMMESIMTK